MTNLGVYITSQLRAKGINTNKDGAKFLGFSESHFSRLINGRTPLSKALASRIASKLGVSVNELEYMPVSSGAVRNLLPLLKTVCRSAEKIGLTHFTLVHLDKLIAIERAMDEELSEELVTEALKVWMKE